MAECCYECSTPLVIGDNWQPSRAKAGTLWCKSCVAAYTKRRKQWRPVQTMLSKARDRATREGIPFSITTDDVLIPAVCPALGIPLVRSQDRAATDNSPSLDKIRPELGYVPGNVVVISKRANLIKSNASFEELAAVARWLETVARAGATVPGAALADSSNQLTHTPSEGFRTLVKGLN